MAALEFRKATLDDLPAIVGMLAEDILSGAREDPSLPLAPGYRAAFEAIAADPNQYLMVAVDGDRVVGSLQLTLLPGLSKKGAWRGIVEAVRIAADRRGEGLGERLMGWAVEKCRAEGCVVLQLTTDNRRAAAHRFYERIGFVQSHQGYKKDLT
jgi:GNAT superfamily N-acetyltransferase